MAEILRDSLNVISVLEEVVTEDRLYKRSELSHVEFPPSKVPLLEQQYLSGWGALLKELYTNLLPFKSHALALEDLKNGWITSDSAATLAKDSIFEGVGVYWTLRDSENHWREINSDRKGRGELPLPKTDVIDAWAITQAKKADFFAARSKHYLGSEKKVAEAEAAYQVFSTAACQLGLVLAIRAIAHRISLPFEGVSDFSVRIVRAINASLKGRLLCLAKDVPENKRRFNLIGKMDSPFAAYFRYFWLEIAATADSVESLVGTGVNGAMLKELALAGRASYRSYLIEEAFKDQKRSTVDTSVSDVQLRGRATEVVDQQLFAGLRSWFGISKSSYEEWKAGLSHVGSAVGDDEAQLEEDSALGEVDEAPDDVDDLISNILKQ